VSRSGGIKFQGSAGPRDPALYPADDALLGFSLFSQVEAALVRGRPAPAVFLLSASSVDRFSLRPLAGRTARARSRMLAAMASMEGVECMAMLGAFRFRGRGPLDGKWVASAFIEWPDNRWWTAWQPIGPEGALVGDSPQCRCADDGSPRPRGMGGWFSLARRSGVKLRVQRRSAQVH
jgi:hypothetical protein